MRQFWLRVCLIVIPLVLESCPEVLAKGDVWVIRQTYKSGKCHTICIGEDGFKFVRGELALVAAPPDWQVTLLNKRTKVCFETPIDDFGKVDWVEPIASGRLERTKGEQRKIAGLVADRFSLRSDKSTEQDSITLWTSTKPVLHASQKKLVGLLFGRKDLAGVPLLISREISQDRSIRELSTDWCQKRAVPDTFFSRPLRFKLVKSRDVVEDPPVKPGVRKLKYGRKYGKSRDIRP